MDDLERYMRTKCLNPSPEGLNGTEEDPDGDPWHLHVCGRDAGHDGWHECASSLCSSDEWA